MEEQYFFWDDAKEELVLSGLAKTEDDKKKEQRKNLQVQEITIYCPHLSLVFNFKDMLKYSEQRKYSKDYQRKLAIDDVVMLQDVKDLALYLLSSSPGIEIIGFLHLPIVDRFLRALILYLQHYLITWTELAEKRAATAKRAPNPLAGGARVQRAQELRALRCLLAREYTDLIQGCQRDAQKYHHISGGQTSFARSSAEKDFRVFEGLIQFGHRVAWITLERKHKELMELEIYRLFRTEAFNTAKRRYDEIGNEWEVPEDEHWILYGPKMPRRRKILRNSPLSHEILYTDCDYRLLCVGLTSAKSEDPRILYLENALLAKEEDLPRLGIKVGILGLPRTDFDLMLIPQASEEDQMVIDDTPEGDDEGEDEYETLMPSSGSDPELTKLFPVNPISPRYAGNQTIRKQSKKKWINRERRQAFDWIRKKVNESKIDLVLVHEV